MKETCFILSGSVCVQVYTITWTTYLSDCNWSGVAGFAFFLKCQTKTWHV